MNGGGGDDLIYGDHSISEVGENPVTYNYDDPTVFASGNDTLNGGSGEDLIYGNGGNDVIYGGAGADRITGAGGADTFVTRALLNRAAPRSIRWSPPTSTARTSSI